MPKSSLDAKSAWLHRPFKVQVLGRKHRNGSLFVEEYPCEIDEITGDAGFLDLLKAAVELVKEKTDIPADLVQGFCIKFTDAPIS